MIKRNKLKMVSNQSTQKNSFFFLNENGEWVTVDSASPLSRREYTEADIQEKIFQILQIIDEVYNTGNRGVDLIFEGAGEEGTLICDAISVAKLGDTISFDQKKTIIAVAGKLSSGKTTLIEEIGKMHNVEYTREKENDYVVYREQHGNSAWYELNGIDLGKACMEHAEAVLEGLVQKGLGVIIYCLSNGKIEQIEETLLKTFNAKHPDIKTLLVLTNSADEEAELFAEQLSSRLGQVRVIPVLAKEIKTRSGSIPPFGLIQLIKYIYEGK